MIRVLKLALLLPLVACQATSTGSKVTEDHPHDSPEQPSVHGMLMVGDGPVYLSHLPMFHSPHDYQVLLEVSLQKNGVDALATYVNDRQVTGERIYTLVPESFVLSELFAPPAGTPVRTSFKASLYRGHFERGGQRFMSNVTVKVTRVVHAKKFAADPASLPELQYLLFGDATQLFAAHVVHKKPDFDHVVAVRLAGVLTDEQAAAIRMGATFKMPSTENATANAFSEGQSYEGEVDLGTTALNVTLDAVTDFYLETGDLEL